MAPGVLPVGTVTTPAFLETTLALAHPRLAARRRRRASARRTGRPSAAPGIGDFVADIPATPDHPSRPELDRIADGVRELDVPALLLWGPRDPVFSDALPARPARTAPARRRAPLRGRRAPGGRGRGRRRRASCAGSTRAARRRRRAARRRRAPAAVPGRSARRSSSARTTTAPRSSSWPAARSRRGRAGRRSPPGPTSSPAASRRAASRPGDRVALLVPPGVDLDRRAVRVPAARAPSSSSPTPGSASRGLTRAVRAAEPSRRHRHRAGARRAPGRCAGRRRSSAAGPLRAGRRARRSASSAIAGRARRAAARASTRELAVARRRRRRRRPVHLGLHGPGQGRRVHPPPACAAHARRRRRAPTGSGRTARSSPRSRRSRCSGPALGATSASPDMDVTAPGTLTAGALAEAVRGDRRRGRLRVAGRARGRSSGPRTARRERAALAGVRLFLSAGAPVRRSLLLEAARALMPRAEAHTPYGMTEVLPVTDVVPRRAARGRRPATASASADRWPGVSGGDQRARRRRRADRRARDRRRTSPARCSSPRPHVKDAVRPALAHPGASSARDAGWHRTGDVGHLDAEGRLWIEGRLAHVLVTPDGVRHARRARATGRVASRASRRRPSSASARVARSRSSWWSSRTVLAHGPGRRGAGARRRRPARRSPAPTVAAVLVVRAPADGRAAQLEDRPDPVARRGPSAVLAGRAGAAVTRVLVTGASGMLGRAVAARLVADGHDVRTLQRSPSRRRRRARRARLGHRRRGRARARCAAGEAVVHLAAKVDDHRAARRSTRRVNVDGTRTAARRGRGRRRSGGSCTSRRRRSPTSAARSPVRPPARPTRRTRAASYARTKAPPSSSRSRRTTRAAWASSSSGPHVVWGPGDTQLVGRVVDRARSGPAAGPRPRRRAHRHDLRRQRRRRARRGAARRARRLRAGVRGDQRRAAPGASSCSTGICAASRVPVPRRHVPAALARGAGSRPRRGVARRSRCRASRR